MSRKKFALFAIGGMFAAALLAGTVLFGGRHLVAAIYSHYYERGVAKWRKGDLDGAIADFSRAITIVPIWPSGYRERGIVKQWKGDLNGAGEDLNRAIEIDPKDAYAYFCRGCAKASKGGHAEAIVDYTHAIELNPHNATFFLSRGISRQWQDDLKETLEDLNRAIEIDPKDAYAYYCRVYVKRLKCDFDGAIADSTRAIELNPKYALAWFERGWAKDSKGDYDGAIADFNRAIEIAPKFRNAYCLRGFVKAERNNFDAALADLDLAVELDPKHVSVAYERACVYWMMGRWVDAAADFRRSREFLGEPKRAYTQLKLWLVRARLGENEVANKELAAYFEKRGNGKDDSWPARIGDFLLGRIDQSALLTAAASPKAMVERGQFADAWFFAGMKHLQANNRVSAAECLRKCLAMERRDLSEYYLAKAELNRLGQ